MVLSKKFFSLQFLIYLVIAFTNYWHYLLKYRLCRRDTVKQKLFACRKFDKWLSLAIFAKFAKTSCIQIGIPCGLGKGYVYLGMGAYDDGVLIPVFTVCKPK